MKKYDPAALTALGDGDEEFYKEMVELFLVSTYKSLMELRLAANQRNYKLAGSVAHKMRGPVNHIGGTALSEALTALEEMSEQETIVESEMVTLISRASCLCEELMKEVSADTGIKI